MASDPLPLDGVPFAFSALSPVVFAGTATIDGVMYQCDGTEQSITNGVCTCDGAPCKLVGAVGVDSVTAIDGASALTVGLMVAVAGALALIV